MSKPNYFQSKSLFLKLKGILKKESLFHFIGLG